MTTRFADHLLTGNHAGRPSASSVPEGTLYSCTDHDLVYQSTSGTWGTWLTAGGGSVATLDDIGDVTETSPTDGDVLTYDSGGWINQAPSGGGALVPSGDILRSGFTRYRFDDSALTGWTTVGTPTVRDADTTLERHLYMKNSTADAVEGVYRSWTPGANKRVILKMAAYDGTANYQNAGIFLCASGTGKTSHWGVRYNGGEADLEWRDYSAFTTAVNNNSAQVSGMVSIGPIFAGPLWLMIKYLSSTSYGLYVSRDGIKYHEVTAISPHTPTSAFTPDAVGVSFTGEGGAATGEAWFEYVDVE